MRAHIRKPLSARHSRKKRLLTLLTSRLFIIVVLILLQLFLLLFTLVELGTRQYWISIAFNILSFLMVLWILPREDNPSYKISWIILIMAIPLVGGIFYLMFGMKRNSRRMARQIDSYTRSLLHRDHGKVTLNPNDSLSQPTPLQQLSLIDPILGRQAGYISSTSGFEVYRNTQVEYFSLGEQFYQRLLEQLRGAQKFILMEYFIVQHGKMWDSILRVLEERQRHGVQVRILYDDVGCVTTLPAMYSEQLRQKGFQVGVFNPFHPRLNAATNYRDHRKICVIDGNVGFTGGINLADEYINAEHRFGYWKDAALRTEGAAVWNFTVMFLDHWNAFRPSEEDYAPFMPQAESLSAQSDGVIQPYGDSPLDEEALAETVYLNIINQAQRYVYIYTPYFAVGETMLEALKAAAKRGVDVRLVLPGIPDKKLVFRLTRSYYVPLLRAGVRIYEFTPGFLHAKCYVSDDRAAVVGSINMDYRSLFLHFECGALLLYNSQVIALRDDVLRTLPECREVQLADCRTSLAGTLLDSVLRLLSPLM